MDYDSFKEIIRIKRSIDRIVNNSIKPTVILANKIDLRTARNVSSNAGIEYATEAGCPHYELSARESFVNIEMVFSTIIEMAIRCSMINQMNRNYQSPHQKETTGSNKDTRERKSSFKSIVKTLTRQKSIKEEIKEEMKEEIRNCEKGDAHKRQRRDYVSNRNRERSSTCTF